MSTIVAVKKQGIAAIGADSMTKFGSVYQSADYVKNYAKILHVGDSHLAYVGSAAFTMIIPRYFGRLKKAPALNSPESLFETLLDMHKTLKDEYYLRPEEEEEDEFESSRLHLLVANESGIYGAYCLRSVDEYNRFFSFGSGYQFALGAMKTLFPTDATAAEIARAGLEAAAEFDDATGGPFEIFTVGLANS